jgi:hypothetical protein
MKKISENKIPEKPGLDRRGFISNSNLMYRRVC